MGHKFRDGEAFALVSPRGVRVATVADARCRREVVVAYRLAADDPGRIASDPDVTVMPILFPYQQPARRLVGMWFKNMLELKIVLDSL